MVPEKYGYSEEFQLSIASFLLRDPSFFKDYGDVIDPTYFDNPTLTSVIRIARDSFNKSGSVPSKPLLLEEIKDFCVKYKISRTVVEDILSKISVLYEINLSDSSSIREKIIRFGKRQALKQGVLKIADLVESDEEFDKSLGIIEGALSVGQNINNLGFNFFKKIEDIPEIIKMGGEGVPRKIRTGLPMFDNKMGGGYGRKEIWVVMGLSGQGKSQFLVSIGVAAILQKIPVIHVTIGDLDEEDVSVRYAARLCRCTQSEVIEGSDKFKERSRLFTNKADNYLRIKYYDPGVATISNIKSYISRIATVDEITPGLIILDYLDEAKKPDVGSDYEAMGELYSQTKAMIRPYNAACWTASQINRWAPKFEGDVITFYNIADSGKKVHKADGIVSINQSWEESVSGRARLWVDKVRRGEKYFLVPLDVDFSSSFIAESDSFKGVKHCND